MKEFIEKNIVVSKIDYISGGERRDWYFSIMLSYLLGIPHVTIFKDLTTVESDSDFTRSEVVTSIPGKSFLHIADLLNQSASFIRGWIPAIKNLGSRIEWSVFAVDRMQGGTNTLTEVGVRVYSMLAIEDSLFVRARDLGIIDDGQLEMLRAFKEDPDGSMKKFLISHPEFIEHAKNSKSEKTRKRVNLMLEKDIYGLNRSEE